MFIGHFAVGFAAKAKAPQISLGTLFLASQLLDLLWPTFLLLGWEHVKIAPGITEVIPLDFTHYPISHSLLAVLGWGVLAGLLYWLFKKDRYYALIISLCVVSHWVLDLLVHRPDLPLHPGDSQLVGLGLWNSFAGSLVVEGLLFMAGIYFYAKNTQAKNKAGKWGFWSLVAFLVLIHAGNLFGPVPTEVTEIAWVGQLQWLLVIWAYWLDRNRSNVSAPLQTQPA
ncbi:hypothetical protein I5M27_07325 [Adhaeribacter sp. BT258]|uniref:LexA-binding, inner membrane-associated hydrolase n=1 Tax=Adhaeribacter terrigena TaxID=2793070 RepID=A0ABS1C047_9BACT|nr:metal-dependent hydrolase [Adhaeribacter terrigena]MBK0402792.1 hypothetical protein [Adhaeribacter terrigena]